MRIVTNITALNTQNQYMKSTNRIASSVAKLSSGYAINIAADNPAGLAISEKMRARVRGLDLAMGNVQNAISLVQTADGSLSNMTSVLQRMRTLAVQAASDTYSNEERLAMQEEFSRLVTAVDEIASSASFNTIHLMGSTNSGSGKAAANRAQIPGGMTFQIGASEDSTMTININVLDSTRLGIAAAGVATRESAENAITAVGNVINTVSARRANLGAVENRLNQLYDRLLTTHENMSAAESRIRDVDMAKEITELTTASILQQVDTAMLVQANAQPQNVLFLLKSL